MKKNSDKSKFEDLDFFNKNGYLKFFIYSKKEILEIKKEIKNDINFKIEKYLNIKKKLKNIENYHNLKLEESSHKFLIKPKHRYIKLKKNLLKKLLVNKKIIYLIKKTWGHTNISFHWIGDLKKKQKIKNATGYRLARPARLENNDTAGVHIDMNVGGIINRDVDASLTVWIPIIGFDKKYTLRISPKSHKFDHGKIFKKTTKISPLLPKSYIKKFKFTRLSYKIGQAIIFHPNLLHGGSKNLGNQTRVSCDTRILNIKRFKY